MADVGLLSVGFSPIGLRLPSSTTMCSMSFDVDHSKAFPKQDNHGNKRTPVQNV